MRINLLTIRNGLHDAIVQEYHRAGSPKMVLRLDLQHMSDVEMVQHWYATGSLLVWTGDSDRTIYGDRYTNWLARATHDLAHINSGVCNREHGLLGCFEPLAECDVADYQCRGLSDALARIIQLEVAGQAMYYYNTGQFIQDQCTWMLDQLQRRV